MVVRATERDERMLLVSEIVSETFEHMMLFLCMSFLEGPVSLAALRIAHFQAI